MINIDCNVPVSAFTIKEHKEPKAIIPTFIRSSLLSTDKKHTVVAIIRSDAMYRYEESFCSKDDAYLLIEEINENPRIAADYLRDAKKINYRKIDFN